MSKQLAEIRKEMEEEYEILNHNIVGVGRAVEGVGRAVSTGLGNTVTIYKKLERLEKTLDVNYKYAEKIYDKVSHELGSVYEMVKSSHDRRMYGY